MAASIPVDVSGRERCLSSSVLIFSDVMLNLIFLDSARFVGSTTGGMDDTPPEGYLFRFDPDGTLHRVLEGVGCSVFRRSYV